jgi:hypothetical protein
VLGTPIGLDNALHRGFGLPRAFRRLAACLALAGCAAPAPRDSVQLGGARIVILQSVDDRGDGAAISVQLGETKRLPLPGYLAARIEQVWTVGAYRLLLIAGTTKDCPRQESLLVTKDDAGQLGPLGKCPDRFAFTAVPEQWSARQLNARDPVNWTFKDGKLTGPVLQSAMNRPRPRPAQPERPPEADRPAEPERTGDALPAATTPAATPAAEAPPAPIRPPPVSRPVGDDVVPPPVGAGPLPGRATPAPRVF